MKKIVCLVSLIYISFSYSAENTELFFFRSGKVGVEPVSLAYEQVKLLPWVASHKEERAMVCTNACRAALENIGVYCKLWHTMRQGDSVDKLRAEKELYEHIVNLPGRELSRFMSRVYTLFYHKSDLRFVIENGIPEGLFNPLMSRILSGISKSEDIFAPRTSDSYQEELWDKRKNAFDAKFAIERTNLVKKNKTNAGYLQDGILCDFLSSYSRRLNLSKELPSHSRVWFETFGKNIVEYLYADDDDHLIFLSGCALQQKFEKKCDVVKSTGIISINLSTMSQKEYFIAKEYAGNEPKGACSGVLIGWHDSSIYICNRREKKVICSYPVLDKMILIADVVIIEPYGKKICIKSSDNSYFLYDTATRQHREVCKIKNTGASYASFACHGQLLIIGSNNDENNTITYHFFDMYSDASWQRQAKGKLVLLYGDHSVEVERGYWKEYPRYVTLIDNTMKECVHLLTNDQFDPFADHAADINARLSNHMLRKQKPEVAYPAAIQAIFTEDENYTAASNNNESASNKKLWMLGFGSLVLFAWLCKMIHESALSF